MKNAVKIYKGYYVYEGYTIKKTSNGWELRNECTGELNYTALTKKECIKEVDYILSWED